MKRILILLSVFLSFALYSKAQTPVFGKWKYVYLIIDSTFKPPQDTLVSSPLGSIAIKNGTIYYKNTSGVWISVIGGGGGGGISGSADSIRKIKVDTAGGFGHNFCLIDSSNVKFKLVPCGGIDSITGTTQYRLDTTRNGVAARAATKQNQLNGTGFVKATGTTISYDNSTYYKASDTVATLQTKYNTNNAKTYPAEAQRGVIYDKTSWSDPYDFLPNPAGHTVVGMNGDKVTFSCNATAYAEYVRILPTYITDWSNWKLTLSYKITAWSASSVWVGPMLKSTVTHSGAQFGVMGFSNTSNSGAGTSYIFDETGSNLFQSGTASGDALNHVIETTLELKNDTTLVYTIRDSTANSSTTTLTYTYPSNQSVILPNASTFAFLQSGTGGTIEIHHVKIESSEIINTNLLIFGDSRTKIGFADSWAGRWPYQLKPLFSSVSINAGSAEYLIQDTYQRVQELTSYNSSQVLMAGIGQNDLANGYSLATVTNAFDALHDKLSLGGSKVLVCCFPDDSTATHAGHGYSAFNNYIKAKYQPLGLYIDTWDSLSTNNVLKPAYNHDDIHLSQAGDNKVVQAIQASGLVGQVDSLRRTPYIKNDNLVRQLGSSLIFNYDWRPSPNEIAKFDPLGNLRPSLIYDDGTRAIVSPTFNPVSPLGSAIFNVNGAMTCYGNLSSFFLYDRVNPTHYYALYPSSDYFNIAFDGGGGISTVLRINGFGQIAMQNFVATPTQLGNFWIKRDYSYSSAVLDHGLSTEEDSMEFTMSNAATMPIISIHTIQAMKLSALTAGAAVDVTSLLLKVPYDGSNFSHSGGAYSLITTGGIKSFAPNIYGANYGGSFTARSLVDKNYVDSVLAAAGGGTPDTLGNKGGLIDSALYKVSAHNYGFRSHSFAGDGSNIIVTPTHTVNSSSYIISAPNLYDTAYTPTLTNTTNITSSTPEAIHAMRVGNSVTVYGRLQLTATTTGLNTVLTISLPFATSMGAPADAGGSAVSQTTGEPPIGISTSTSATTCFFKWSAVSTINQIITFSFTYHVTPP